MIYSYQNFFPRGLPNHYMFIYYLDITCYLYISCYLLWVNFVTRELMILIIYFTADASGSLYIILRSRKTQNAYVLVFGEAKSKWFFVRKNQGWHFSIICVIHSTRHGSPSCWCVPGRHSWALRARAAQPWIECSQRNIEIPEFQEFHLLSWS